MRLRLIRVSVAAVTLALSSCLPIYPSTAANPSLYESLSGVNSTGISSSGSSDSVGFTGNWSMVNAYKNPYMVGVAAIYRNSYNSNLKFPSNSRFSLPSANTAAGTVADTWNVHYSARQMNNPINFDSNGTFYLSFLAYCPYSMGSWGSNVIGLLNGLPTTVSDTSKNAIFLGRTYSGAPTIQLATANVAVWNPSSYTATGTANNPSAPDGNSWFVIAKITTSASGNDTIQLKFFASTDTLPISDSGITWDVTYSTAISGNYNYLSVQTEYNGIIDEIRGGATYDSVSGAPIPPTIGLPTVSGQIRKGITSNLTVNVESAGFVRFYADGKRIAGCLSVPTTGSSPSFTATCVWKPTVIGIHQLKAEFTSSDTAFTNITSQSVNVQISQRVNTR